MPAGTLALIAKLCYNFAKLVFHYIVGEGQEREMNIMSKESGPKGPNTLRAKVIGSLAGIGMFCTSLLTGCGGSAEGKPAPVATATETSPSPTSAETTTPSATPSATPRPTETPKPSPSPTVETASPSPETPKTPPARGSIEDYDLLTSFAEKMRKMSDKEWAELSEEEQLTLVSAAVEDAYIKNFTAFELNNHIFKDDYFDNRTIADVGSDPDPYDVVIRTLARIQAALASETGKLIPSGTGETNYMELDQTTARRILDATVMKRGRLFEDTIEGGVVTGLAGLPEEISVTGFDKYSEDGEDYMAIRLKITPSDTSGHQFTFDEFKIRLVKTQDHAGRETTVPVLENGFARVLWHYVMKNH